MVYILNTKNDFTEYATNTFSKFTEGILEIKTFTGNISLSLLLLSISDPGIRKRYFADIHSTLIYEHLR